LCLQAEVAEAPIDHGGVDEAREKGFVSIALASQCVGMELPANQVGLSCSPPKNAIVPTRFSRSLMQAAAA